MLSDLDAFKKNIFPVYYLSEKDVFPVRVFQG
jgi:hypothetical protein